ncbi:MAG: translation elongation factor Ts [Patescibacteria group bacterium]|nr:translation elongation factor Ts [Patescibacteria group bacterium]
MNELIKKIREQTGAGVMDIKKALMEAGNDEKKAIEILRKHGQKVAAKKSAERVAKEGLIEAYVHGNGKVASLIMLSCETDFVARNSEFKELAHDLAMQVAAMNPQYLSADKIPAAVLEEEREIIRASLKEEKKPKEVVEKIIDGKLNKFYSEFCLLEQPFIKDDEKTVKEVIAEKIAKLGEKIEVKKIARLSF